MWKKKEDFLKYHRNYVTKRQQRWRKIGCCIDCGLPCAPYWRCLKHRVRASIYSKRQYRKRKLNKMSKRAMKYRLSCFIPIELVNRIANQLDGRNQSEYVRLAIENQLKRDESVKKDYKDAKSSG